MLRITADIFSGRPNPVWKVSDEGDARATLRELTIDRSLLAEGPAGSILGFRGLRIDTLSDELAQEFGVSASLYLAVGPQARGAQAAAVAERLIGLIGRGETRAETAQGAPPLELPLRDFLATQLELAAQLPVQSRVSRADEAAPVPPEEAVGSAVAGPGRLDSNPDGCFYEVQPYAPYAAVYWNTPPIQPYNNCYNYASNKATDNFAQPGYGSGNLYTEFSCGSVSLAAQSDGMLPYGTCQPDSQAPRMYVALVIWPGVDYHWYRLLTGLWGHKPGQTAATYKDNAGNTITNPQTANRGGYTDFCGFFYGGQTQRNTIKGWAPSGAG